MIRGGQGRTPEQIAECGYLIVILLGMFSATCVIVAAVELVSHCIGGK